MQSYKQEFRIQGCTAHIRKRPSGKNTFSYQIRYRRNGYNVSASGKTIEEAKEKFLEKLNEVDRHGGTTKTNGVPNVFGDFAEYYFEKFYKRRVSEATYKNTLNRYNNHIKPTFGTKKLKAVTALMCQEVVDRLTEEEKFKTADEVYCILNTILRMAIKHNLLTANPIDIVFLKKHTT